MKKVPFYPLFFVSFSILSVISDIFFTIDPLEGVRSFIVLNIIAAILIFSLHLIMKDKHFAAFLVFNLFLIFFHYGFLFIFISKIVDFSFRDFGILAAWILPQIVIILAWKKIRTPEKVTEMLNFAFSIALLSSIFLLGKRINFLSNVPTNYQNTQIIHPLKEFTLDASKSPDIYYIVVDGYGRSDVLSEIYGFENTLFLDYLTKKGFYIANQSNTNYIQTPLSISSTLNLNYFDDNIDFVSLNIQEVLFRDLMLENPVFSSLKEIGYTTIATDSNFYFTLNPNPDIYFSPYIELNTFEQFLLAKTPLLVILDNFDTKIPGLNYNSHRKKILFALEQLVEIPTIPGPKFVFVHLLIPHPPFVFDQNGNSIQPDRPFFLGDGTDFYGDTDEYRSGYRDQVIFLNNALMETIDQIFEKSLTPPIIILQGDHGPGSNMDFFSLENSCIWERVPILNAYFFPDEMYLNLDTDISPVNSFRAVFNTFFGTDFEYLENKTFFSSNYQQELGIFNVTEKLSSKNNCSIP